MTTQARTDPLACKSWAPRPSTYVRVSDVEGSPAAIAVSPAMSGPVAVSVAANGLLAAYGVAVTLAQWTDSAPTAIHQLYASMGSPAHHYLPEVPCEPIPIDQSGAGRDRHG